MTKLKSLNDDLWLNMWFKSSCYFSSANFMNLDLFFGLQDLISGGRFRPVPIFIKRSFHASLIINPFEAGQTILNRRMSMRR